MSPIFLHYKIVPLGLNSQGVIYEKKNTQIVEMSVNSLGKETIFIKIAICEWVTMPNPISYKYKRIFTP